jgi:hypothetical protein
MMGQGRKKETAGNAFCHLVFFWHLISCFLSFFLSFHSAGGALRLLLRLVLAGFVISFSGMSFFALSCLLFIFL